MGVKHMQGVPIHLETLNPRIHDGTLHIADSIEEKERTEYVKNLFLLFITCAANLPLNVNTKKPAIKYTIMEE